MLSMKTLLVLRPSFHIDVNSVNSRTEMLHQAHVTCNRRRNAERLDDAVIENTKIRPRLVNSPSAGKRTGPVWQLPRTLGRSVDVL